MKLLIMLLLSESLFASQLVTIYIPKRCDMKKSQIFFGTTEIYHNAPNPNWYLSVDCIKTVFIRGIATETLTKEIVQLPTSGNVSDYVLELKYTDVSKLKVSEQKALMLD